jgi:hypothetical protein
MLREHSNIQPPHEQSQLDDLEQQQTILPRREALSEPRLRTETLEICPDCGEPTKGAHKCHELTELVEHYGSNSIVSKLLSPILEKSKSEWLANKRGLPVGIQVETRKVIVTKSAAEAGLDRVDLASDESGAINSEDSK